jgi:hypothetical protein
MRKFEVPHSWPIPNGSGTTPWSPHHLALILRYFRRLQLPLLKLTPEALQELWLRHLGKCAVTGFYLGLNPARFDIGVDKDAAGNYRLVHAAIAYVRAHHLRYMKFSVVPKRHSLLSAQFVRAIAEAVRNSPELITMPFKLEIANDSTGARAIFMRGYGFYNLGQLSTWQMRHESLWDLRLDGDKVKMGAQNALRQVEISINDPGLMDAILYAARGRAIEACRQYIFSGWRCIGVAHANSATPGCDNAENAAMLASAPQ